MLSVAKPLIPSLMVCHILVSTTELGLICRYAHMPKVTIDQGGEATQPKREPFRKFVEYRDWLP